MSETVLYQSSEVTITTSKLVFGSNTYFLKNVSGISVQRKTNIILIFLYFLGALGIINALTGETPLQLIGGIAFIAAGLLLRNLFCVLLLDTNSGRVAALKGRKNALFEIKAKVEEALNEAS